MGGGFKGKRFLEDFKKGIKLTRTQAMKAKCYDCNGGDEGRCDCLVTDCPMYDYRLYPNKTKGKKGEE